MRTPNSVFAASIRQGFAWSIVFLLCFNTLHHVQPSTYWPYGYSLTGVLQYALAEVVAPKWAPLVWVALAAAALALWVTRWRYLIKSTLETPVNSLFVLVMITAVTLGVFEAVWHGLYETWFWSWHLLPNAAPPILIMTVSLAGRSGYFQRTNTGSIETDDIDSV
jgi:hypothetical protein